MLLAAPPFARAGSVQVDGVTLPDAMQVAGVTLRLNGFGLRTFSLLRIHIYVAALYLQHPSDNPDAILQSPETKLLTVVFRNNVSAAEGRRAWRRALADNCQPPCQLDPHDLDEFLADIPAMHSGETFDIVFTEQGATVSADGRTIGVVPRPGFATAMLAAFLGPRPTSPALKTDLLRGHG